MEDDKPMKECKATLTHYQKYKDTIKRCNKKWLETRPDYIKNKMKEAYHSNPQIRAHKAAYVKQKKAALLLAS